MTQLFFNEDCDAHFDATLAAADGAPLRVVWADIGLAPRACRMGDLA